MRYKAMSLGIKTLSRSNWQRVIKRKYTQTAVSDECFTGQASLIHMEEITAPLVKSYDGVPLTIVDRGYYWMQLAPTEKKYWLTVMLDTAGNIISYYFDITDNNVLCLDGDSYFYDLYLDVVLLPNGNLYLLDEDELLEALRQGVINQEQFDDAYITARMLLDSLPGSALKLQAYCLHLFAELKGKLVEPD
jgi:predicted RNA-binding protein associated with RNAse of E/G family